MTLLSLITLSFSLALSLLLSSSPLFLGLWILFLALSLSMLLSLLTASWLGIFMFLIYVGGLLVMFAYFVALAPNQLIEAKSILLLSFTTYLAVWFILSQNMIILGSDLQAYTLSPMTMLIQPTNTFIYITLALILFFALVAVVKISTLTSGPLRPYS